MEFVMKQALVEFPCGRQALVDEVWIAPYANDPEKVKVAGYDAKLIRWVWTP
jgi:hypothetical protein